MSQGGSSSVGRGAGIVFVGALTIAFIVLKLCGVIGWPWWLVLSPLWISMILFGLLWIGLCAALLAAVIRGAARRDEQRRPQRQPVHGPVRRWGYRPGDVDALRSDADRLGADRRRMGHW